MCSHIAAHKQLDDHTLKAERQLAAKIEMCFRADADRRSQTNSTNFRQSISSYLELEMQSDKLADSIFCLLRASKRADA